MIRISSAAELAAEFSSRDRFLILTHERPDGDAVGSALGLYEFLKSCGKRAEVRLASDLPEKYRSFASEISMLDRVENLVFLDCATARRIAQYSPDLSARTDVTRFNIDHHSGNDVTADFHWVDSSAPATSVLCTELAVAMGNAIGKAAATRWMLGLLTDTGAFRFSNTTPRAFRTAELLLSRGAEYEKLVNLVYFSKPRNQQLFEAELVSDYVRSACDGKYVYAVIPGELFEKHHFSMRDGEGLIDLLREIDGSVIAALLYLKAGSVKISLRSKDEAYPVLEVARPLGGGGHKMAAGITISDRSLAEAAEMLEEKISALLEGKN